MAKGKKWQEHAVRGLKVADRPPLVLGPSGNLRAPALLVGNALVVGFNEEAYDQVFGG